MLARMKIHHRLLRQTLCAVRDVGSAERREASLARRAGVAARPVGRRGRIRGTAPARRTNVPAACSSERNAEDGWHQYSTASECERARAGEEGTRPHAGLTRARSVMGAPYRDINASSKNGRTRPPNAVPAKQQPLANPRRATNHSDKSETAGRERAAEAEARGSQSRETGGGKASSNLAHEQVG